MASQLQQLANCLASRGKQNRFLVFTGRSFAKDVKPEVIFLMLAHLMLLDFLETA